MANEAVAEKLAQYLACEKIEGKTFGKEVVNEILLNPSLEQVCDSELKRLWSSIKAMKYREFKWKLNSI